MENDDLFASKSLTLYELNSLVKDTIESVMTSQYWVEAELSECRESHGHCYMELVQKDEGSNTLVARAQARCWRNTWAVLRPYFERTTGQELHAGMKVLLLVYPQFHQQYGFSWIVTDINPEFTLGDMARKRMEIIRQLKAEGVFELQKELAIPRFAQRIAVISSATAAGYGDFCNQLSENGYGFKFHTELFAAIMQGTQVESSIISALNKINDRLDEFDVVVIIRGGGGTSDFSGFDTLALAENVANFPIPIITGIGHERDECVLDMVSNTRVKTPTAAAAFLIDNLATVYSFLEEARTAIINMVRQSLEMERSRFDKIVRLVPLLFSTVKTREELRIERMSMSVKSAAEAVLRDKTATFEAQKGLFYSLIQPVLERHRSKLRQLELQVKMMNPKHMLKYGYSITYKDGRAVRDPHALKAGDVVETVVEKGKFKSTIV